MNIFSLSLKKGIFPEKMKIAKVSPIFKKGDKSILSNYRPISVLFGTYNVQQTLHLSSRK